MKRSWLLLPLALASAVNAAEPDANRALRAALLCDGDPLAAVQALAVDGSAGFEKGYAGHEIGEEIDTKSIVILRVPIDIAGATTSAVVGGPSPLHEDFGALVQARFVGDWKAVAAELQLRAESGSDLMVRALPSDAGGDTSEACPMTIQLKPLEEGRFLLGCGWCNG